ncbi:VOC family protein [Streptomyces sp. NPDC001401]|uniref:VOC family protein n=1 Tax=Streptomyces sp. NPDC001401 TaxID=3364570 RepID=UPI0036A76AE6
MSVELTHLTLYSDDPVSLARFWAAVFAKAVTQDQGPAPRPRVVFEEGRRLEALYFERPKGGNLSGGGPALGIQPERGTLAEEVARLMGLGALILVEEKGLDGLPKVTMSDPDGNQFVVVPSKEEQIDWERVREAEGKELASGTATAVILVPDNERSGNGAA